MIECTGNVADLAKVFNSVSKDLRANEKHFKSVRLYSHDKEITLEDNTFSDITFEDFYGDNVIKIGSNAFNKTANKIKTFNCYSCSIEQQPPKYDIQKALNQMNQLNHDLKIGLNVNEIPSNAFANKTQLSSINLINKKQNLTIESGAFQDLENLHEIIIGGTTINRIKKEAFKSNSLILIQFSGCKLTGESFENGAFDGIQKPFTIILMETNVNYFAESVFKQVLNNSLNSIDIFWDEFDFLIDCDDCRNYWLIKENKQNQVKYAHCIANNTLTLFDQETKTKLSQKCK